MPKVREMEGVSAQIVTLKTNDGVRRHPSHCIYAEGKGKQRLCTCPLSLIYNNNCKSSSKCDYYEEKEKS